MRQQYLRVERALEQCKASLHYTAFRIARDREAAQDIVQEALSQTVAAITKGRQIENIEGWLHRCVQITALMHLRREKYRRYQQLEEECHSGAGGGLADQIVDTTVSAEIIEQAADLPARQLKAFLMKDIHGIDNEQIATHMNTNVAAVRQLVFRARRRLRSVVTESLSVLVMPGLIVGRAFKRLAFGINSSSGNRVAAPLGWLTNQLSGPPGQAALAVGAALLATGNPFVPGDNRSDSGRGTAVAATTQKDSGWKASTLKKPTGGLDHKRASTNHGSINSLGHKLGPVGPDASHPGSRRVSGGGTQTGAHPSFVEGIFELIPDVDELARDLFPILSPPDPTLPDLGGAGDDPEPGGPRRSRLIVVEEGNLIISQPVSGLSRPRRSPTVVREPRRTKSGPTGTVGVSPTAAGQPSDRAAEENTANGSSGGGTNKPSQNGSTWTNNNSQTDWSKPMADKEVRESGKKLYVDSPDRRR